MSKKSAALFLSIVMFAAVCIPGTLTIEASGTQLICGKTEHTHTNGCYTRGEQICALEESAGHAHGDECYKMDEKFVCGLAEDKTHTHGNECKNATKTLICGREETEGHTHTDDCDAKALVCILEEHTHSDSCYGQQPPVEPEVPAHIEGCSSACTVQGCACACHTVTPEKPEVPLEPAAPAHIEGCSDECDGADCECVCHLFGRLMACETYEELMTMIMATPEDGLNALPEEQVKQVEEKVLALEPQPLPEIVIGEAEETDDAPVPSKIEYVTVNFDDVAPFGDPVVG